MIDFNDPRAAQIFAEMLEDMVRREVSRIVPVSRIGRVIGEPDRSARTVDVSLFGQDEAAAGFAYGAFTPRAGDRVRVMIDPRGDRYVDAVLGRDPPTGPILDVTDEGAVLDGVRDDTRAWERAFEKVRKRGGGIVGHPGRRTVISNKLVLPPGVSLMGADRASEFFLAPGSNCPMIEIAPDTEEGYYGTLVQFLRDFKLDGNKANQDAGPWHVVNFPDDATPQNSMLAMDNVWVQFAKGAGIYIGAGRIGMTLTRCIAWGGAANGIEVHTSDTTLLACSGGQNVINLLLNNWGCHVMGGAWFAATGIASIHLTGLARYCHVIEAGIDRNAQRGVYIEGEYNQVIGNRLGWNSDSAADTYDDIEVSTPKLGNVVQRNIRLNQGTRSRALLSVGGGSVGIYGPNIVEPGSTLYEAYGAMPVKMAIRPRAAVWRNSVDQSIPNAVVTPITFTTERTDPHGLWTAGAPTMFVIPANRGLSGWYTVKAQVQFDSHATGIRQIRLATATAYIAIETEQAVNGSSTIMTISRDVYLNDGDLVELTVYQTSGGALNVVATNAFGCEFQITRLED